VQPLTIAGAIMRDSYSRPERSPRRFREHTACGRQPTT
jgi:hypothetical protein